MTATASLEVSLMRLISPIVFRMASAPRSASTATSSERRAVSLAFDWTWSIETSISFIDEQVSSAVSESASTFLATSLMEYAISSMDETVSRTLAARLAMFSATSSFVAVISRIERRALLGARGERLDVLRDLVMRAGHLFHGRGRLVDRDHLLAEPVGEPVDALGELPAHRLDPVAHLREEALALTRALELLARPVELVSQLIAGLDRVGALRGCAPEVAVAVLQLRAKRLDLACRRSTPETEREERTCATEQGGQHSARDHLPLSREHGGSEHPEHEHDDPASDPGDIGVRRHGGLPESAQD